MLKLIQLLRHSVLSQVAADDDTMCRQNCRLERFHIETDRVHMKSLCFTSNCHKHSIEWIDEFNQIAKWTEGGDCPEHYGITFFLTSMNEKMFSILIVSIKKQKHEQWTDEQCKL